LGIPVDVGTPERQVDEPNLEWKTDVRKESKKYQERTQPTRNETEVAERDTSGEDEQVHSSKREKRHDSDGAHDRWVEYGP